MVGRAGVAAHATGDGWPVAARIARARPVTQNSCPARGEMMRSRVGSLSALRTPARARAAADRSGEVRVLFDLGWIAIDQARWADAVRLNAESLALARAVAEPYAVYRALTNLGWARLCCGEGGAAAVRQSAPDASPRARRSS